MRISVTYTARVVKLGDWNGLDGRREENTFRTVAGKTVRVETRG
jgi:hypothetical protein